MEIGKGEKAKRFAAAPMSTIEILQGNEMNVSNRIDPATGFAMIPQASFDER